MAQRQGITIRFPPDLDAAVADFASRNGISLNEAVRLICRTALNSNMTHAEGYLDGWSAGRNEALRRTTETVTRMLGALPTSPEAGATLVAQAWAAGEE
jgi:hypothetical protein